MAIFRQIIRKSFALSLRHKHLWFFGFFGALVGFGGEFSMFFKSFDKINQGSVFPGIQEIASTGIFSFHGFKMLGQTFETDPFASFIILFVAIVIIAIVIFIIWLIVISQASLINHVTQIEKGKKTTMQEGFDLGMKKFAPLFGINFIAQLIIFLSLFIFLLPLFFLSAENESSANDWYYALTFIVLIPITFIISFIAKYASAYVVLKKERFWPALEKGWQLFTKNWLITLETAFLVFIIIILVGLALFVVAFLITIPFLVLISIAIAMQSTALFWFLVALWIIIILIISIIALAIMGVFQWSCWTMLFNRLETKEGALSRLQRWGNALRSPKPIKKKRKK